MGGDALPGGGLAMRESAVSLGPPGDAARYRGRVTQLAGTLVRADVGAASGSVLRVALDLRLSGTRVSGTVRAVPVTGGNG
jgi:hypothetical protein